MNSPSLQSQREKILRKARKFFRRFFMAMGILFCVLAVFAAIAAARLSPSIPNKILLTYTFTPALGQTEARPALSGPLLRAPVILEDVTRAIHAAAADSRVRGFAAKIDGLNLSPAQVQELRDAILKFRNAGKFAYVYADTYGGMGEGMGAYYLAAAFDAIWLQPVGMVAVNGMAAQIPFARDLLDKIGAEADFSHKGKYKSAPESLTSNRIGAANREMMTSIVGDLSAQMFSDIAKDRGFNLHALMGMRDQSPFGEKQALELKLVDQIGYADEMKDAAEKKAGLSAEESTVNLAQYIEERRSAELRTAGSSDKKIALVYGTGEIVPTEGAGGAFGDGGMSAAKISEAFESVLKDDAVAAVVFRIDSPGGSPAAAETIRRVVMRAQKSGKPVVVSMSGYAASGGYWIAAPADKIVAQPGSLTGSIGVFGGKIVLAKLWDKIGLHWDTIAEGSNATMWSANSKFSSQERARFDSLLDGTYESFLQRVMEGRKMTREQAAAVAEGRVFTGRQAKENGLVDMLGGLDDAAAEARKLAGLDGRKAAPLVSYPPEKSRLELLSAFLVGEEQAIMPFTIDVRMPDVAGAWQSRLRAAPVTVR